MINPAVKSKRCQGVELTPPPFLSDHLPELFPLPLADYAQADPMEKWVALQLPKLMRPGRQKMDRVIDQWSQHLAHHLKCPEAQIREGLLNLYNGYLKHDVNHCLKVINSFPVFPAYPDMVNGTFSEHINFACNYLKRATQRTPRIAPVLFCAFSKTASAHITVKLDSVLRLPTTVLSFQHQIGIRPWVRSFARFGGATHDHYHPTPANLGLLHEAGVKRCVIHRRHPVQTIISHAFHFVDIPEWLEDPGMQDTPKADRARAWLTQEMDGLMRRYASWWLAWQREAAEGRIDMLPTRYEDMVADETAFFKRLFAFYGVTMTDDELQRGLKGEEEPKKPALRALVDTLRRVGKGKMPEKGPGKQNFRRADPEEWKEILTLAQVEKLKRFTGEEFPDYSF